MKASAIGFTTQQRYTLRQLGVLVVSYDQAVAHRIALQQQLASVPEGLIKQAALRRLAEALAAEQQAIEQLRDGVCYLANLVRVPDGT